jgi:UDP-3-O-[3-hydroxymyristoyl] glucosamine N-acyltransferase
MPTQLTAILERFPNLLKLEHGNHQIPVENLSSPGLAGPKSIIFVWEGKHLEDARASKSQIWIVGKKLLSSVPNPFPGTLLSSPNPYLAMALIAKEFFPLKPGITPVNEQAIHPSAVISKSARLGQNVKIGPNAVIGDNCRLEDEVVIGANAVLEPNVKVGKNTHIHPLTFIGHSCEIGSECEIKANTTIGGEGFGFAHDEKGNHYRITHYGRVIIENRVHIGSGVQIDRGTFEDSRIGEGTIIDNHCHFGHNIQIGKNSIFVGGTLVAGSVKIGSNVVFGGRCTISGHLEICDNVQLMGVTSIGKSIVEPGQYGGLPIQKMQDVLKTRAVMLHLPEMRKQLLKALRKLDLE